MASILNYSVSVDVCAWMCACVCAAWFSRLLCCLCLLHPAGLMENILTKRASD